MSDMDGNTRMDRDYGPGFDKPSGNTGGETHSMNDTGDPSLDKYGGSIDHKIAQQQADKLINREFRGQNTELTPPPSNPSVGRRRVWRGL